MAETAPIDITNIMSARGVQLLRSVRITFELIAEHRKQYPSEYSTINAAIASHLRSCDPIAAQQAPSVEMPVIASPVIGVAPETSIVRTLHGEHSYAIHLGIYDGETLVSFKLTDDFESALVTMQPAQAEQLQADIAAVRAAVKRG